MAGMFEWQFKYRDEAGVNAGGRLWRTEFEKLPICRDFCDSSDFRPARGFGRTITIARGGACPCGWNVKGGSTVVAAPRAVIPCAGGESSTPQLIGTSAAVSED